MSNETDTAFNYRLLNLIERRPEISQRDLAAELGLSLGKINYCLKAFVVRGLVKVDNFCRSDNKRAYAYLLTPKGIEEKARVTVRFFRRVETEYETLKQEKASILDLTPLILSDPIMLRSQKSGRDNEAAHEAQCLLVQSHKK